MKTYDYKIYRNGSYLGNLPQPSSDFGLPLDLYTVGASLTVRVPISADTSILDVDALTTEDGTIITDESGNTIYIERQPDVVGNSSENILIRNGNQLKVYEYSDYHPNGKLMFSGKIRRWRGFFGDGSNAEVSLIAYSDGRDMGNYLIQGATATGITQNTFNDWGFLNDNTGPGWNRLGQTFAIPAGIPNIKSITLKLKGDTAAPTTFTLKVWRNANDFYGGVTPLGTATQVVSTTTAADYELSFNSPIDVVDGATYFYSIQSDIAGYVALNTADVYALGTGWSSLYSGGSGGGSWAPFPVASFSGDLYFIIKYVSQATYTPYTSVDPTFMLQNILNNYNGLGGAVTYTDASTDDTGLSVSYPFQVATVLEGVQKCAEFAPSNFYWFVDPGTQLLTFKQTSATADITLVKGTHIAGLDLGASIESLKNLLLFTGGDDGSGHNLYRQYSDQTSIDEWGQELDRRSDNRVTVPVTADAIGDSFIDDNKDERYITEVQILDTAMDITLIKPGMTIGFAGFGNFIDRIILRIERVEYNPEVASCSLGKLPARFNVTVEQLKKSIEMQQTIDNPTTPS
jgi:hypothetical protein